MHVKTASNGKRRRVHKWKVDLSLFSWSTKYSGQHLSLWILNNILVTMHNLLNKYLMYRYKIFTPKSLTHKTRYKLKRIPWWSMRKSGLSSISAPSRFHLTIGGGTPFTRHSRTKHSPWEVDKSLRGLWKDGATKRLRFPSLGDLLKISWFWQFWSNLSKKLIFCMYCKKSFWLKRKT